MTENRAAPRVGFIMPIAGIAALTANLLLAACSQPLGSGGSTLRVYAADLSGGAKTCIVPNVDPIPGKTADAAMNLANDGGWCGLRLHQSGPKPYEAGLLTARATHGNVTIHEVGDETRVDYVPDRGFSGSDSFSVQLIPGNASISVAVTVTKPQA